MASQKELELIMKLAGEVDPSLPRAVKSANKELDKAGLKNKKSLKQTANLLKSVGTTITRYVTLPALAAATMSVKAFAEMDSALREAQATIDATPSKMEKITAAAKKIAPEVKKSVKDAAGAFKALTDSGLTTARSLEVLPAAMKLSKSASMDVAEASALLSDSMYALDMGSDEINVFLDQMTRASQIDGFGLTVAKLGDAIREAGEEAQYLSGGTAEMAAALGVLSQERLGGESLKNILQTFIEPSKEAKKQLKALGVSAVDAEGHLRPLNETFSDLEAALDGKSAVKQKDILSDIFGEDGIKAAQALMKNSGEEFTEWVTAIRESSGATDGVIEDLSGGLSGAVEEAKTSITGLLETLGEKLAPTIESIAGWVVQITENIKNLDAEKVETAMKAIGGVALAGPLLSKASGFIAQLVGAESGLALVKTALAGLSATGLGPLLGIAGAVGGIALAIAWAQDAAIRADLASRFGEISLSADEMKAIARTARTSFADDASAFVDIADDIKRAYADLRDEDRDLLVQLKMTPVNKELSEQEINDLKAQASTYVYNAGQILKDEQLAIQVGIEAYISVAETEKDKTVLNQMSETISGYFTGLDELAAAKGKELREAVDNALADGVLDAEERKTVDKLRSELSQIISEGTLLDADIAMGTIAAKIRAGEFDLDSIAGLSQEIDAELDAALAEISKSADHQLGMNEALFSKGAISRKEADEYADTIRRIRDEQILAQKTSAQELKDMMVNRVIAEGMSDDLNALKDVLGVDLSTFINEAKAYYKIEPDDIIPPDLARYVESKAKHLFDTALKAATSPQAESRAKTLLGMLGGDALNDLQSLKDEYIEAGKEIPKWIDEGIATYGMLNFIGWGKSGYRGGEFVRVLDQAKADIEQGIKDGSIELGTSWPEGIAAAIRDSSDVKAASEELAAVPPGVFREEWIVNSPSRVAKEIASAIPEGAALGIRSGASQVKAATQYIKGLVISGLTEMVVYVQGTFISSWSSAWDKVSSRMIDKINTAVTHAKAALSSTTSGIPGFAEGGTLTRPTLAMVAEAGYAETIIPHKDTARSRALLLEAAQGMGLTARESLLGAENGPGTLASVAQQSGGASEITVSFSPNINVSGASGDSEALQQTILAAITQAYPEFTQLMDRYFVERGRVSYGTPEYGMG